MSAAPATPVSIVVVDDDASMCQAIARLLTAAGWHVTTFPHADAVLETDAAHRADVLVLDVNLPGLSGLELHQRLVDAGVSAPVIFITAHDMPFIRSLVQRAGALAFLPKPFPGKSLLDAIRSRVASPSVPAAASPTSPTSP